MIAAALAAAACSPPADEATAGELGDSCDPAADKCKGKLVCVLAACRQPCVSNSDCPERETCEAGVCSAPKEGECGDGHIDLEEACDDGNTIDGDGCRADCEGEEDCGDGWVDVDEQCDDGNADNDDSCFDNCLWNRCVVPLDAELCNGVDDDCDGYRDEGFDLGEPCTVGRGVCARTGVLVCNPDQDAARCDAIPGEPQKEICDGLDNNCDGIIDEGSGTPDGDGDGFPACSDCGDDDDKRYPGATERCNGMDDDCDQAYDETFDLGADCSVGQGECLRSGLIICDLAGTGTTCSVTPGSPRPEICDGLDNDCDGHIDDEDDDIPNLDGDPARACSDCDDEDVTRFPGNPEICNGQDENCDEIPDEIFAVGEPCSVGLGACLRTGVLLCNSTKDDTVCDAIAGDPSPEICDGLDNDCDGLGDNEDDDIPNQDGDPARICSDCDDDDPSIYPGRDDPCNARDDNCNGEIDEDDPSGDSDGDGYPGCSDCADNDVTRNPGRLEICDNVDHDCSGSPNDYEMMSCTDCYDFVFTAGLSRAAGGRPFALGDVNGDGIIDFVEANGATDIALADLNGDGFLDRVVGRWASNDRIELNDGAGGFSGIDTIASSYTTYVATGDVNGDGHIDILVGKGCSGNCNGSTQICHGDGTGTCSVNQAIEANTRDIAVADLTGDGIDDYIPADDQIYFGVQSNPMVGASVSVTGRDAVAAGDLDGDGDMDVVAADRRKVNVYLNPGDGLLALSHSIDTNLHDPGGLAVGDVDGDCDGDIFLWPMMAHDSRTPVVFIQDESSAFLEHQFRPTLSDHADCSGGGIADLDDDGLGDLVMGFVDMSGDGASIDVYVNDRQ